MARFWGCSKAKNWVGDCFFSFPMSLHSWVVMNYINVSSSLWTAPAPLKTRLKLTLLQFHSAQNCERHKSNPEAPPFLLWRNRQWHLWREVFKRSHLWQELVVHLDIPLAILIYHQAGKQFLQVDDHIVRKAAFIAVLLLDVATIIIWVWQPDDRLSAFGTRKKQLTTWHISILEHWTGHVKNSKLWSKFLQQSHRKNLHA